MDPPNAATAQPCVIPARVLVLDPECLTPDGRQQQRAASTEPFAYEQQQPVTGVVVPPHAYWNNPEVSNHHTVAVSLPPTMDLRSTLPRNLVCFDAFDSVDVQFPPSRVVGYIWCVVAGVVLAGSAISQAEQNDSLAIVPLLAGLLLLTCAVVIGATTKRYLAVIPNGVTQEMRIVRSETRRLILPFCVSETAIAPCKDITVSALPVRRAVLRCFSQEFGVVLVFPGGSKCVVLDHADCNAGALSNAVGQWQYYLGLHLTANVS